MKRGFAILLLCAPIAFGQKSRVPPTPPPPSPALLLDATVTDPAGRAISGLSAADFEITQAGEPQKIDSLTWFDTKTHAAATATPPSALNLSPDHIRRNIVLVVDDLGLPPERAAALQSVLRAFVSSQLAADDYAAIVRTSSGSSREQQLTTDRRALVEQVEHVQPLGRGMSDAASAGAIWQCIRWAIDGLRAAPGRKAVVLVSEHLKASTAPAAAPSNDYPRRSMALAAHGAMTVFYTVDPRGPAEPPQNSTLALLVRETGGIFAADLSAVLRDQEGYYVIGFHPATQSLASTPPVLQLHGKVGALRWRFGFLTRPEPRRTLVPPDRAVAMQQAQIGAAGGDGIRVRVTPLFTGFTGEGAVVECLVHIDARDLAVVHGLKGTHQLSAEIQLAGFGDSGRISSPPGKSYTATLGDAGYQQALRQGLVYTTRLTLPGPGGYEVRAVVADGVSDRFGSAMQFVEVPGVNRGAFATSGLLVRADTPADAVPGSVLPADDQASTRIFKQGSTIAFTYGVFNALPGPAKESRLHVQTRLYATARLVYEGRPIDLDFPANNAVREITGKVHLDDRISPGEYVIEVEVTDLLAPKDAPRVAIQYMTFEVRE
jgi:VWFA-related protein